MNKPAIIIICSVVACALAFIVTDCSAGRTWSCPASVVDKEYSPPWTETRTSTDSEGRVQIHTTHHDATWTLICKNLDGPEVFRVGVSDGKYQAATIGQEVVVRLRQGRFTGINYIPRIE